MVNANLDVTEYAQAEFVAGTANTDPYVKIYGIGENNGKIVRSTSYLKITGGTHITIQQSGDDVVITHTGSSATETTGSALNFGSDVITEVTTDNTGHVTSVKKSALPQTPNMSTVLSNRSNGATDTVTENPYMNLVSDNLVVSTHKIQSGSKMDVRSVTQEGTFNVLVSHQPTTRTNTTSTTQPTALATAITTDTTGHVTEVTTVDPDDVTVGKAKDLESPITENDDTTWNYRETGGEISIGEDIARVSKLKGNTIVWNQQIPYSKKAFSTSTSNAYYRVDTTLFSGHKYYLSVLQKTTLETAPARNVLLLQGSTYDSESGTGSDRLQKGRYSAIITCTNSGSGYFVKWTTANAEYDNFMAVDLTKMFGSDDAIKAALGVSTLEEQDLVTAATNFEKLFPNSYYPYCEGRLVNLGGYGVKWNQNVENGDFSNGNSGWSGITSVSSGVATKILASTGSSATAPIGQNKQYTINHKYLFIATVKSNNSATRITLSPTGASSDGSTEYAYYGDWTTIRYIWTGVEREGSKLVIRGNNSLDPNTDINFSIKNVMCIDLTEMFGPGSEPTLEEFEAMFPDEYYEYNEGTEMNIFDAATGDNKLGLESTGFNQWDEQWNTYGSYRIESTNFIPVIQGKTYYFKFPTDSRNVYLYDRNKNSLGSATLTNNKFTVDNGVAFIKFNIGSSISPVLTYNNDICINISSSRDGEYEPYKKDTLDLDWVRNIEYTPEGGSTPEKLFPYGLLSAGSVYDEVGENYAIKRVGAVDLGTMDWIINNSQVFQSLTLGTIGYNALCKRYLFSGTAGSNSSAYNKGNMSLSIYTGGDYRVYIRDDSYSELTTFKNSLQGVMLYYELATPVVVYFDEKKKLNYFVDDHGTEQQLPVNGSSVITSPFIGTFEYKSNFKDAVIDLIDTVNSYKNPVRGQNNTAQTVGELAVYDSDSTVSSSGFKASNGTITTSVTDKDKKLPTIESVIEYVQRMTQSAIHYLGVINSEDRLRGPHAMGDMFIAGTTFTLDGKQIDVGDYLIRNSTEFVSGIPLSQLWDVIQGKVSVSNAGATLVMNGASYPIATVEGTQISVTTPNLNVSSPSASSTEISFIDDVYQRDGLLSATKKTVQSASKQQPGVVQFVSSVVNSVDDTKAVTAADAWTEFAKRNVKASVVSSTTPASIIPQVVYSSQLPTSGVEPDNWNALVFGRWSSTPLVIGMIYVHLPEKKAYISVGTEAPTDWKMITNI